MRWPFVTRERHERMILKLTEALVAQSSQQDERHREEMAKERDRYTALVEQVVSMKRDGYSGRTATAPVAQPPAPDPEQRALNAAHESFVSNATAAFMRDGKSEREAQALAEALRDQVTAYDSGVPAMGL